MNTEMQTPNHSNNITNTIRNTILSNNNTMIKYNLLLLLSLLVIVTGCRKDIDGLGDSTEVINPVDVTNSRIANLNGLVSDLEGGPISNANVELNGEIVTTDQYGYFRFTDKVINREGSKVTISKTGYFDSYKFVYPTSAGDYSHIKVSLPLKELAGTFNATSGGAAETVGGAKMTFSPNTIMDANGNEYTGSVNIYAHWYNPNADDISIDMPGDLRAINTQGDEVQLATFGMLAVELETPDGQPLNISEGNTAELTFPLEELTDGAPNEIPMWYLDEETGIWVEEGQATKVGNTYVGEVSHFSFWNCDAPFPLVNINGIIKDSDDNLLTNAWLCMQVIGEGDSWWNTGYGWTDQNGEYAGKIPKNKIIRLSVKDNCGNVIYEEEIGPFDSDISMDPIVVDYQGLVTVFGMVTDCGGDLVTDGYVVFNVDNPFNPEYPTSVVVSVDEEGNFSYSGDFCESLSGTLQAYDYASATFSDEFDFEVTAGAELDLGVISLCEQLDEFFTFNVDGVSGLYTEMEVCILDGNLTMTRTSPNGFAQNLLNIDAVSLGDNIAELYSMSTSTAFIFCDNDCNSITWDITELGTSIGDYLEGTFEGEADLDSVVGSTVQVSGSFRAPIDYIGAGASISGMAWEDTNSNGIREAGEPPLENIYIGFDSQSTQTDADGQYSFTGLKPGTYQVWMESNNPAGPVDQGGDDTIDNDFDGWNGVSVTLAEGENLENLDAGLVEFIQPIECVVFVDGYCEWTQEGTAFVEVFGGVGPYVFQFEDGNGNVIEVGDNQEFSVGTLPPGTYGMSVTSADGAYCYTTFNLDFGIGQVSVAVWQDDDLNGEFNELDLPAVGTVVELYDANGNLQQQSAPFSEDSFDFTFLEVPGDYYVKVIPPAGFKVGDIPVDPNPDFLSSTIFPDDAPETTGQSEIFTITGCDDFLTIGAAIVPE